MDSQTFNILFISHECNYFIDNNATFYRMYKNLFHFHNHPKFNVVVLQPDSEKESENLFLKGSMKTYYYKHLIVFRNNLIHFLDFNPWFLTKIIKILKKHQIDLIHVDFPYGISILKFFTKKPIIYNAYNVESIYYLKIGKFYKKLPPFLRSFYVLYIYLLERNAVKISHSVNAFSEDDRRFFINLYSLPLNKVINNQMGYKKEITGSTITQKEARKAFDIDDNKFVVIFHGFYFINDANKEAIHLIKDEITDRIKDKDILFLIAGKMPKFKNKENIKFLGYVDDINKFLYAGDVAIVPIFRGSGVRIKMIDYLSAKIPIITTKQAALGLIFKDKIHGYIVSDENPITEMIHRINFLKNNPKILKEFKTNISILLEESYNWNFILDNLEKHYIKILHNYQYKN